MPIGSKTNSFKITYFHLKKFYHFYGRNTHFNELFTKRLVAKPFVKSFGGYAGMHFHDVKSIVMRNLFCILHQSSLPILSR